MVDQFAELCNVGVGGRGWGWGGKSINNDEFGKGGGE